MAKASRYVYLGDFEKYVLKSILDHGNATTAAQVRNHIIMILGKKLTTKVGYSTVHICLKRLENKAMVRSTKLTDKKKQLSFEVTPVGIQTLAESIRRLDRFGDIRLIA